MKKKICIIASNFYPKITKILLAGANIQLKKIGIKKAKIIIVPGTFEIPVIVSSLIKSYHAFIVLGCVIKGQTSHYNYLCTSTFNSLSYLSVKNKIPIGNGILTCDNKKQAFNRANNNTVNKGGEAANAVISVLKIIK